MFNRPVNEGGYSSFPRAKRKYWSSFILFILITGLFIACTRQSKPSSRIGLSVSSEHGLQNYCAFGLQELKLEYDATVDCGVGSNGKIELRKRSMIGGDVVSTSDEVVLHDDANIEGSVNARDKVKIQKRAEVGSDIISGDDVELEEDARVTGSIFAAGSVKRHESSSVGGSVREGAAVARLSELSVSEYSFTEADPDVKVEKGRTRALPPGRYGDIKVEENGVLNLSSGHYMFKKMEVQKKASINLNLDEGVQSILVDVLENIVFKDGDVNEGAVMTITSAGGSATDVLFRLQDGDVEFGKNGSFVGTFVGAASTMKLKEDAWLTGGLYGKTLEFKERANFVGEPVNLNDFNVNIGSFDVVDLRIVGDLNDAEEDALGEMTRHSPDLELVNDLSNQTVGMRFTQVPIPFTATVLKAYIQFQVDETSSEPTTLLIQGQAADDTLDFSNSNFDLSSRPRTEAAVSWSPPAWTTVGEAGPDQQTADISSIIQEIVDRPGWVVNNAMVIVMTGSGKRVAEAFDGDPNGAPVLHLEYAYDDSVNIANFSVSPAAPNVNNSVTFSWNITDTDGDSVSCELDVNNDAEPDYFISNCISTRGKTHSYAAPGIYGVTLTATDGTGASTRAFASVGVVTPSTVTVAAAGDIACDPADDNFSGGLGTEDRCRQRATSDLIIATDPDAVLALGDIQYEDGALEKFWQSYDPSWGRFKDITYPAVGNHEYLTLGAQGYFDYFGAAAGDPSQGYYSFDLGDWHIVALNSNCSRAGGCRAGSPQERWLREDLAAHPDQCALAFWHHPRFSSGAIGGRDWSSDWWRALQEAGAEVVLVGHEHTYERFAHQDADGNADANGLRQFVVGTGGRNHTSFYSQQPNSEVRRSGSFGVLKLALHPDSYDWEFVSEPGDNFTDLGSESCR